MFLAIAVPNIYNKQAYPVEDVLLLHQRVAFCARIPGSITAGWLVGQWLGIKGRCVLGVPRKPWKNHRETTDKPQMINVYHHFLSCFSYSRDLKGNFMGIAHFQTFPNGFVQIEGTRVPSSKCSGGSPCFPS